MADEVDLNKLRKNLRNMNRPEEAPPKVGPDGVIRRGDDDRGIPAQQKIFA